VIQLDDIVGYQAAPARDELERELTFAHTAVAGQQHAHAEHVEQHAVTRHEFREGSPQIGSHDPDDLQARQRGCHHRDFA
jgi:hypothetical protein